MAMFRVAFALTLLAAIASCQEDSPSYKIYKEIGCADAPFDAHKFDVLYSICTRCPETSNNEVSLEDCRKECMMTPKYEVCINKLYDKDPKLVEEVLKLSQKPSV